MKKKVSATVVSNDCLATGIYSMWLETKLGAEARPGQFVGVSMKNAATLLPRPISICEATKDRLRLVYRVVGQGTDEMSKLTAGTEVTLLGNLGNGYPIEELNKLGTVMLFGGGIGIPPMVELAKNLTCKTVLVMGYRNSETFLTEELKANGALYLATEDGSLGTKGNVLDAVREQGLQADAICACGPMPMLRALKKYAEEQGIPAYISLEERMACGVGACLGCVAKTVEVDHHTHVKNTRICTEGPVFEAREVEI